MKVERLADAAQLASLADETPRAAASWCSPKEKFGLRGREVAAPHAHFVPFTAQTRMSGVDLDGRSIRKGRRNPSAFTWTNSVAHSASHHASGGKCFPRGGTPLVVAEGREVLGVIHLKDVVKGGIKERFAQLRKMGIKTVMITGDNPLTAAAIAAESGVDDFMAQTTPEAKLKRIRDEQAARPSRRHDRRRHERRTRSRPPTSASP